MLINLLSHEEDGWQPVERALFTQTTASSEQQTQASQQPEEDVQLPPDTEEAGRRILEANLREPTRSVRYGGSAGASIPAPVDASPKEKSKHGFSMYGPPPGKPVDSNIYAPFASATDWLVARWAKMQGPGSTAMTDLLKIPLVSAL